MPAIGDRRKQPCPDRSLSREKLRPRHCADSIQCRSRQPEPLDERLRHCGRCFAGGMSCQRAALDGGAVKESLGRRHAEQGTHFPTTARLAEKHDAVGIAAEIFDVVAYPLERSDQIQNSGATGVLPRSPWIEVGEVEITEAREAMRHSDYDDVAEAGK